VVTAGHLSTARRAQPGSVPVARPRFDRIAGPLLLLPRAAGTASVAR